MQPNFSQPQPNTSPDTNPAGPPLPNDTSTANQQLVDQTPSVLSPLYPADNEPATYVANNNTFSYDSQASSGSASLTDTQVLGAPDSAQFTPVGSSPDQQTSFASAQSNIDSPFASTGIVAGSASTSSQSVTGNNLGSVTDTSPMTGGPAGRKNRFSKKMIGIIAAVGLVVVSGSAALAYVAVMNTPQMILRDAFYATSTKTEGLFDATIDFSADNEDVKVLINGAWKDKTFRSDITLENEMLPMKKLTAHQYVKDQKVFLKVDGIRKNIDGLDPQMKEYTTSYDGLINKLDGKWLVITESDLEEYFGIKTEQDKSSLCVENALATYQSDKKQQKEVYDVYVKNQFLTFTKLADEDVKGRKAYQFSVVFDKDKANSFVKAVESSKLYKNIENCLPKEAKEGSSTPTFGESKDTKMPEVKVWVDKESRTLRKVQIKSVDNAKQSADTKITAAVVFDYFSPVSMSEPKADVTVKELMDEFSKVQQTAPPQTQGLNPVQTVLGISDRR